MDKQKSTIRYRIPVSVKFPSTHPRKGEETDFVKSILTFGKRHTIRSNYALWAKRFEKIERGEAVLELYHWSGKPYNSKAVTICQLGKEDGVGIQQLNFEEMIMCAANECFSVLRTHNGGGSVSIYRPFVNGQKILPDALAKNDGLKLTDFKAWFKGYDLSQPMAIIHFTPFRY